MAIKLKDVREPKSGKEAASLWHARLERAVEFRDKHWNGPKTWRAANRLVKGDHWKNKKDPDSLDSDQPDDRIKVNVAGSVAQDFEAYLMRRPPSFTGEASERAEDQTAAEMQGNMLNYFWREQRMQKQAKRAVRDMINVGHGIVRTGWIQELNASINPNRDGKVEYRDIIKAEMPVIKRVSPFRFVFSEEASEYDLESARWCAEMLLMPLGDMMTSQKYANDKTGSKIINKIKSGDLTPEFYQSDENKKGRDAIRSVIDEDGMEEDEHLGTKLVVIYDVWDKKHNAHFHILAGVNDDFLFYEEWPYPYLDGFPYIMGSYIELNDTHYAKGLMIELQDQQHELNRIRTAQFQHRRKMGRSLYMVLEAVNDSELTKLRTGKDGDAIKVPHMSAISQVEQPQLSSESYRMEEIIKEDIRQLSGQNAMMAGAGLPSRTSAAEVNKRASYSEMKMEDRIMAVDDMILRIGIQVLQHAKANMKKEKVIRIMGAWGNEWVTMTPEDIKAEIDLNLISTSTPKGETDLEKSTATNLMNMILQQLPTLQQMGVEIDMVEMFKWIFRKHGAEKEAGRFFRGISEPPGPQLPSPEVMAAAQGGNQVPGAPPAIGDEQMMAQMEGVQPQSMMQGPEGELGGGQQF
jgi:hypothetical protein